MSVRGLLVLDVSNNKKNVGLKRREFERKEKKNYYDNVRRCGYDTIPELKKIMRTSVRVLIHLKTLSSEIR